MTSVAGNPSEKRRLEQLNTQLADSRVDAMLVTSMPNIRYLTGFTGSTAILLVSASRTTLITDFRYKTQVEEEIGNFVAVVIDSESLWNSLWRLLGQIPSIRIIGFETLNISHRDYERTQEAGARWQWRPMEDQVEMQRQSKDVREVELIADAAAVATRALESWMPTVHAGMTELEIAGNLERTLRKEGSEGFPFATIVASGPRSALPHARTSPRTVGEGELLLIDFGAVVGGYCSDITRTFVVGSADTRTRDTHSIVRSANELASAGVRSGMKGRDADAIARTHIERAGFGNEFGHGLGHGIGLQVHEAPRLSRNAEGILPASAVVTIEPGIYIPGWGGVRIEDDVYLSTDGPRVLTHFTRDLVELR